MTSTPSPAHASRRVALVTGAGRNIGRAIALALARDGMAVAVNVRSSVEEGQSVVDAVQALGMPALLCVADVTDAQAVRTMVMQVTQHFGRIDVLVNNAAIRKEATLADMSSEAWRSTLAVVLDGAFHCTQAALPWLQKAQDGAVVNIGGLTAHAGAQNRVHVVTAKAGLVGFTRAVAHDLAPYQVTVNCVAPGMIDTVRQGSSASAKPQHHQLHKPLLERRGTAQEVADSVAWLAGPQARFVTGQVLHVNGGTYLGS